MRIIASLGVTTVNESSIKKIILAGADIMRHNFSYYGIQENLEYINNVQKVIDELHADIKHLIDLPLNKIRLGDFNSKIFAVRENEELIFRSASYSNDCNEFIPVQTPKLGEKVRLNQTITIGDGEIALQVIEILDTESIRVKVLNNGMLKFIKTFNIEQTGQEKKIIDEYTKILEAIKNNNVIHPDYIAISYINHETNEEMKKIAPLCQIKNISKIIIKIENYNGIQNIERICQDTFYDIILIDRGELAVNLPYSKLGIFQKEIIRNCKKFNKSLIVSTQILESVVNNYVPSRSDILDLANIVLDGAFGIMFCHETAGHNVRPAYAISVAKKIIEETESFKKNYETQNTNYNQPFNY